MIAKMLPIVLINDVRTLAMSFPQIRRKDAGRRSSGKKRCTAKADGYRIRSDFIVLSATKIICKLIATYVREPLIRIPAQ